VLTHASIVFGGMLASVNSANSVHIFVQGGFVIVGRFPPGSGFFMGETI